MDWKQIGQIVGANAPLIGKAVSFGVGFIPGIGPIASTIVGPLVGNALAGAFGVAPTPAAVAQAIADHGGPDSEIVKAKLAAVTEELKAKYAFMAEIEKGNLQLQETQITQVNETMRAELPVDDPFKTWWRPLAGYIADFGMFGVIMMLLIALAEAMFLSNSEPLKAMQEAWPLITLVIGMPLAVVGVAIWKRGDEKIAATNAVASGNAVLASDPLSPSKAALPPPETKVIPARPPILPKTPPAPASRPDLSRVDPRERVQTG
jgi:hypothetical protein